jgi:hypothetical protein
MEHRKSVYIPWVQRCNALSIDLYKKVQLPHITVIFIYKNTMISWTFKLISRLRSIDILTNYALEKESSFAAVRVFKYQISIWNMILLNTEAV